jgi:hypothetical protein
MGVDHIEETPEPAEISEIKEDKIEKPVVTPQIPPQMPTMPNGFGGVPPVDISQINDSHLDMMKGMMSTPQGREMMRNMMKSQTGMEISDEQLQMMSGMMNKDTLQMAMKANPNLAAQQPGGAFPRPPTQGSPTAPQDAPNMANASNLMEEMQAGGQPSMDTLMKNKDMIKMTFNMLKTNPAMIRNMTAGMGPGNPVSKFIENRSDDDLKKMAVWLERLMNCFMFMYPVIKIIRDNFRALMVFVVLYFVYRYLL